MAEFKVSAVALAGRIQIGREKVQSADVNWVSSSSLPTTLGWLIDISISMVVELASAFGIG